MRNFHLVAGMSVLFAFLLIGPVFATVGYSPGPLIAIPIVNCSGVGAGAQGLAGKSAGFCGAPALSGVQMSGIFFVQYEAQESVMPLELQNDVAVFEVCGNVQTVVCANVQTTIRSVGPGVYSYSFNIPPSPTGPVSIMIPTGALFDGYGRAFPQIATQIGAYSLQGSPSTSILPTPPGTPVESAPQISGLYREATPLVIQPSPLTITQLVPVFAAIALACAGVLLVLPSRRD